MQHRRQALALTVVVMLAAAYYATCSLMLHWSFHSNGWDLGLFDQVLWNTAHGRPFEYSFRDMSYAGDHWQPVLLLLVPLGWLPASADLLLLAQAVALAVAAVPLWYGVTRIGGYWTAWAAVAAYVLGLGVARAVNFDFHPEAFAPLAAFTAFWALATGRTWWFVGACVVGLGIKEDAVLLVLALCWMAGVHFHRWRLGAVVAGVAVVYAAIVMMAIMPHARAGQDSLLKERYSYTQDRNLVLDSPAIAAAAWDYLGSDESKDAALLLLAGVAFLPLLKPKLLPALLLVTLPPLASEQDYQRTLDLHYAIVPATVAVLVASIALADLPALLARLRPRTLSVQRGQQIAAASLAAIPLLVFAMESPLPPSWGAETHRFTIDDHDVAARRVVEMVPADVPVSAQAAYVAHLAQRREIFQFPRIGDAEYVILDSRSHVPGFDMPDYDRCREDLPRAGFVLAYEEDGIALWRRILPMPGAC